MTEDRGSGKRQRWVSSIVLVLATAVIGTALTACGGASSSDVGSQARSVSGSTGATSATDTAPPSNWRTRDKDQDNDNGADDEAKNIQIPEFGPAADKADRQAITKLIKRYYAAALSENVVPACAMIYTPIEETMAESYGVLGPPYLRGAKSCPAVLSKLFHYFHEELAAEVPLLSVIAVRLYRSHGLVLLGFGSLPEREIKVERERHTWKMGALLD